MSTILALAPHPDDLEIGCGGTLAVHAARGDSVHMFIATCGDAGGEGAQRRREQEASAAILGIEKVHWGDFPDTRLPEHAPALMRLLETVMGEVSPDRVYVNYRDDTHQDHRTMAEVANSVTRYVPNVLAYETPSSIGFEPTVFMDIQPTLETKVNALKAHASQVDRTHLRLDIVDIAMATAHFRGVQARIPAAEAFMPVRMRM